MDCSPPGCFHAILQARLLEWVAILQGIFPILGLNPRFPHFRQIVFFYHLSHQGSQGLVNLNDYSCLLVDQWLRLQASNAGGTGSIPGQGTNIPCAAWYDQKKSVCKNLIGVTSPITVGPDCHDLSQNNTKSLIVMPNS